MTDIEKLAGVIEAAVDGGRTMIIGSCHEEIRDIFDQIMTHLDSENVVSQTRVVSGCEQILFHSLGRIDFITQGMHGPRFRGFRLSGLAVTDTALARLSESERRVLDGALRESSLYRHTDGLTSLPAGDRKI